MGSIRRCLEAIQPTLIESFSALNLVTYWLIASRSGCITAPLPEQSHRASLQPRRVLLLEAAPNSSAMGAASHYPAKLAALSLVHCGGVRLQTNAGVAYLGEAAPAHSGASH